MSKEVTKGTVAERAISEMNDSLLGVFEQIRDKCVEASKVDILTRYDIGVLMKDVMADASTYGTDATEKLAAALGMGVPNLYAHQQVAAAWDREELQKLLTRKEAKTGYHLSWSHAVALSTVASKKMRKELVAQCFEEQLQAKDLSAIIRQQLGSRGNNKRGRPMAVPRSPAAGLAKLHRLTASLINSQDVWEEAIFDRLAERPGSYASDNVLEQLAAAEEAQTRLEVTARHNRQRIRTALDAVQRAIKVSPPKKKGDIEASTTLPIAEAKPKSVQAEGKNSTQLKTALKNRLKKRAASA